LYGRPPHLYPFELKSAHRLPLSLESFTPICVFLQLVGFELRADRQTDGRTDGRKSKTHYYDGRTKRTGSLCMPDGSYIDSQTMIRINWSARMTAK